MMPDQLTEEIFAQSKKVEKLKACRLFFTARTKEKDEGKGRWKFGVYS
jgi:hypothetical protein